MTQKSFYPATIRRVLNILMVLAFPLFSHAADAYPIIIYNTAKAVMTKQYDPASDGFWTRLAKNTLLPGYKYVERYQYLEKKTGGIYRYLHDQGKITKDDASNVVQIIEGGRKQKVDQMDITLTREQFLGLQGALKAPDGTSVSFQAGSDGKTEYRISVKYK